MAAFADQCSGIALNTCAEKSPAGGLPPAGVILTIVPSSDELDSLPVYTGSGGAAEGTPTSGQIYPRSRNTV